MTESVRELFDTSIRSTAFIWTSSIVVATAKSLSTIVIEGAAEMATTKRLVSISG